MGNADTKLNFRKSVVQLTTKTQPVDAADEAFWSQFWSESVGSVQDVFTLIPAAEIRALREELPSNLATLCYKAVEKLVQAADSGCRGLQEQHAALNCIRLLTRLLPYMFEDPDWRSFFWSSLPSNSTDDAENPGCPLAQSLLNALCDLLFCPEFTVTPNKKSGPDNPEDMQTIDSCEYIWEAGVGFAYSQPINVVYDQHRCEILKLLLTCFSETMYLPPVADAHSKNNQWIDYLTSADNRHALPLFTSLLNVTCAYDPIGYGVPYNHLMFNDSREALVEVALQLLCVSLETSGIDTGNADEQVEGRTDNLFVNYLSRIHRDEDFSFILKGVTRLLNNPLVQTYLPGSCKRIAFHQELLVFFWKLCDVNKKFMFYVLKSSAILEILVPVLCFLNDARADQSRVGLVHIGVFILLLLSGERNFGVRLNKHYHIRTPMDLPVFTGTHADFLVIVFHKLVTTGHQRLQPLFDCLLTIIVNVSPYLKTLSMVASSKLVHLLEAFSTPWFLYANANNHHLVFFLLEAFNNLIQYQFDGNANLVYTIIRKRNIFHQLANLPVDHTSIAKALMRRGKRLSTQDEAKDTAMDGSRPAADAQPGTLKASLAAVPVLQACVQVECRLVGADPIMRQTIFESGVDEQPPEMEVNGDGDEEAGIAAAGPENAAVTLSTAYNSAQLVSAAGRKTRHNSLIPSSNGLLHLHGIPRRKTLPLLIEDADEDDESMTKGHDLELQAPPPPPPLLSTLAQMSITSAPRSDFKAVLAGMLGIDKMTEQAPASAVHVEQQSVDLDSPGESVQPTSAPAAAAAVADAVSQLSLSTAASRIRQDSDLSLSDSASVTTESHDADGTLSPVSGSTVSSRSARPPLRKSGSTSSSVSSSWMATPEWVQSWKQKLPLQTIMRLLQVLVPQVEKICIDKGLTDETEILKFLQHGTLVGLLPVPHPILIRKYQANAGTTMWFKTYMWGVVYLRNVDPPIWYDTDVKLFEIQRV